MKTIICLLLLAVVNLIHCQELIQMIVFTLQGVLEKLEGISNKLEDVEQKLGNLETSFQVLHHELEHVKGAAVNNQESLQKLHLELDHLKGVAVNNQESLERLSRETGQCLRGEDLEHLTNVSAEAHQEIKSFVHGEIAGVISLAQRDECSEGSLPCGRVGSCTNTLFSFTCSCPSGFTWDGSDCADIDECAEGKGVCVSNATCKNNVGNYSCSCNKPFEGDGRTFCGFQCRSPAKLISGLGCIKRVEKYISFREMNDFCQEGGWWLVQHFNQYQLNRIVKTFRYSGEWIGVYDEKWTSDESLVPEDLWEDGYRSDPSKRCGFLGYDYSSSSLKVTQRNCSVERSGFCQFQLP